MIFQREQLDPVESALRMGLAMKQRGDLDGARSSLEQVLHLSSPYAATVALELGQLLELRRELPSAAALYHRAAGYPGTDAWVRASAAYHHARVLRQMGQHADAMVALRHVVGLNTEWTSSALFELASIHEQRHESDAAAASYYQIVCAREVDQSDRARAGYLHGLLLRQSGDTEGARTAFSYAIGLGTPWTSAAAEALAELPRPASSASPSPKPAPLVEGVAVTTSERPPQPCPPRAAVERSLDATPPRWVPLGQTVEVHGFAVPGGVLVGAASPNSDYARQPALIDPTLAVSTPEVEEDHQRDRSPAYSELSPSQRATFLAWLADGRRDPQVHVAYVLLYFYGLEHRVLNDLLSSGVDGELTAIADELRRLNGVYGSSETVAHYSRELIELVAALAPEAAGPPLTNQGDSTAPPLQLLRRLSQFAAEGEPVPADWAVSWARHHPAVALQVSRAPSPARFRELFERRYREAHGDGLRIERLHDPIQVTYRPANLQLPEVSVALRDTVDVFDDEDLVSALRAISAQATRELLAYNEYTAAHPDAQGDPAAVALLPDVLPLDQDSRAGRFVAWARDSLGDDASAVVAGEELISRWYAGDAPVVPMSNPDATSCAQLLERHGIGIEPDVRVGGTPTAGPMVLFDAQSGTPRTAGPEYAAAALLLELAVAVSLADGEISQPEQEVVLDHLASRLDLSDGERERLLAHLDWLTVRSEFAPSGPEMRRRLAELTEAQRSTIAETVLLVAAADGVITPDEATSLRQVHLLLGLDPPAIQRPTDAAEPTEPPFPTTTEPPAVADASDDAKPEPAPPGLDHRRLAATRASTAAVSSLLGGIFADDGLPETDDETDTADAGAEGSSRGQTILLQQVITRERWTRAEFDELARQVGLMPSAALDAINERALELCGEPLLDVDDDLILNQYAALEFAG